MPLRHRIKANAETVQDLALAAEEKYWEGIELLAVGRRGAGIYLLGYCVEMMLKNAALVITGARPGESAFPRLVPLTRRFRARLVGIPSESNHSLWYWIHALRQVRSFLGRPMDQSIDAAIVQRVRRVHGMWTVEMRYKPDEAAQFEADLVYNDVTWIRDRRLQLVR